ncbi:hypothetical protein D9M70_403690 [compost metagenome]
MRKVGRMLLISLLGLGVVAISVAKVILIFPVVLIELTAWLVTGWRKQADSEDSKNI